MMRPSQEASSRTQSTHVITARPPVSTNSLTSCAGASAQRGLEVLQSGGPHPLLVPGTDVGTMDVAKHDAGKSFRTERGKLLCKPTLHLWPAAGNVSQLDSHGVRLRVDHFNASSVEADPAGGRIVVIDEARHLDASRAGALQRERTVLASRPHQRVSIAHVR